MKALLFGILLSVSVSAQPIQMLYDDGSDSPPNHYIYVADEYIGVWFDISDFDEEFTGYPFNITQIELWTYMPPSQPFRVIIFEGGAIPTNPANPYNPSPVMFEDTVETISAYLPIVLDCSALADTSFWVAIQDIEGGTPSCSAYGVNGGGADPDHSYTFNANNFNQWEHAWYFRAYGEFEEQSLESTTWGAIKALIMN